MTRIDIVSGFLGAGKTTLIKKLIQEAFQDENLVIIENEFGQIAIDGGFLKDSGINITEMNSGCICCSLVGDFSKSLLEVQEKYHPDRIIIEPSGVGKLSDVIKAVKELNSDKLLLNSATTVVDAKKCKVYQKNFGEFYNNQLENANCVIFSRSDSLSEEKLKEAVNLIREKNSHANIITTAWKLLNGSAILAAMTQENLLQRQEEELIHRHLHDRHGEEHDCCGFHHHHHSDHDRRHEEHCDCGCHDHHHHHEEHCDCGCHDPQHEHHHHADEVFSSWGCQTVRSFTVDELKSILSALDHHGEYGHILRAKGIVPSPDGKWLHFDYVPEESEVRFGNAEVTGGVCVIGSELNESALQSLFS